MLNRNKDVLGDYDFSRSDKFYLLRIPTYVVQDGVVLYEMHLKDLTNNEVYVCKYRFKELKTVHETLEKFDIPHAELPPFPKTHFWIKTNNSPQLIEKRRVGLQNYLSKIINNPYLRGYPQVKRIIRMCKKGSETKRRRSGLKTQDSTEVPRSLSFDKASVQIIPKEQWQKLRRKNTMLIHQQQFPFKLLDPKYNLGSKYRYEINKMLEDLIWRGGNFIGVQLMQGQQELYFEKQGKLSLQCGRHSLNNILGGQFFSRDRMNILCKCLSTQFISPHKHIFGGDYDVNVLMYALQVQSYVTRWHDRRNPFKITPLSEGLQLVGYLINIFLEETMFHKVFRVSPRHWTAIKRRVDMYQFMDSKQEDYQLFKKDEAEKRIVEMLGEYHDSERKAEVIEVYRKVK